MQSVATLIGYGAAAVNPYLMLETLSRARRRGPAAGGDDAPRTRRSRAVKGIAKGLLKTISKMGISTIPSYCGAQIFEAIGLAPELVERHFTGTASRIGGIGIDKIAEDTLARHARALSGHAPTSCCRSSASTPGGATASTTSGTRRRSRSSSTPCARGGWETYEQYSQTVNDGAARRSTIRGLLRSASAADGGIPLEEVEPAAEIVKRFSTGAMSLGSLSREAHETLAVAMNRIGGRSNTGEGGEDPVALRATSARSAIKQVASGRFGVNIDYLTNADELQIKMAQGAKPGEGGQLPGHKVDRYIAARAADDAGRRADLAAAAPRHLLDRGPEAADLRPALREPRGARSRSSSSPRSASARSPPASRRRTPTTC